MKCQLIVHLLVHCTKDKKHPTLIRNEIRPIIVPFKREMNHIYIMLQASIFIT